MSNYIGEDVPESLGADLKLEKRGRETLIGGVALCEKLKDFVSRDILAQILHDTEEHIDFLETELALVKSLGLQNYLQSRANGLGEA